MATNDEMKRAAKAFWAPQKIGTTVDIADIRVQVLDRYRTIAFMGGFRGFLKVAGIWESDTTILLQLSANPRNKNEMSRIADLMYWVVAEGGQTPVGKPAPPETVLDMASIEYDEKTNKTFLVGEINTETDRLEVSQNWEGFPFQTGYGLDSRWRYGRETWLELSQDAMKEYDRIFRRPIVPEKIKKVSVPETRHEKIEAMIDAIEREIRALRAKEHDYNSSNIVMARRIGKQHEYEELLRQADEMMLHGNPSTQYPAGQPLHSQPPLEAPDDWWDEDKRAVTADHEMGFLDWVIRKFWRGDPYMVPEAVKTNGSFTRFETKPTGEWEGEYDIGLNEYGPSDPFFEGQKLKMTAIEINGVDIAWHMTGEQFKREINGVAEFWRMNRLYIRAPPEYITRADMANVAEDLRMPFEVAVDKIHYLLRHIIIEGRNAYPVLNYVDISTMEMEADRRRPGQKRKWETKLVAQTPEGNWINKLEPVKVPIEGLRFDIINNRNRHLFINLKEWTTSDSALERLKGNKETMDEVHAIFNAPLEPEAEEVQIAESEPEKIEAAIDAIEREIRTLRAKEHDYNSINIVMAGRLGKQREYEDLLKKADEAMLRGNPREPTEQEEMNDAVRAFWNSRRFESELLVVESNHSDEWRVAIATRRQGMYCAGLFQSGTQRLLLLREPTRRDPDDDKLVMNILNGIISEAPNRNEASPILSRIWVERSSDGFLVLRGIRSLEDQVRIQPEWWGRPWEKMRDGKPTWTSRLHTYIDLGADPNMEYARLFRIPIEVKAKQVLVRETDAEKIEKNIDIIEHDIRALRAKEHDYNSTNVVMAGRLGRRQEYEDLLKQSDETMLRGNPMAGSSHTLSEGVQERLTRAAKAFWEGNFLLDKDLHITIKDEAYSTDENRDKRWMVALVKDYAIAGRFPTETQHLLELVGRPQPHPVSDLDDWDRTLWFELLGRIVAYGRKAERDVLNYIRIVRSIDEPYMPDGTVMLAWAVDLPEITETIKIPETYTDAPYTLMLGTGIPAWRSPEYLFVDAAGDVKAEHDRIFKPPIERQEIEKEPVPETEGERVEARIDAIEKKIRAYRAKTGDYNSSPLDVAEKLGKRATLEGLLKQADELMLRGNPRIKPITFKEAKALKYGQHIYSLTEFYADRQHARMYKVNGKVKTWKHDPNRIRVPLKYGMFGPSDYLTENNLSEYSLVEPPPPGKRLPPAPIKHKVQEEPITQTESEKIEEKIDIIQRDIRDYRAKTSDFDSPPLVIAEKLGKRAELEELLKQADELMMRENPLTEPPGGYSWGHNETAMEAAEFFWGAIAPGIYNFPGDIVVAVSEQPMPEGYYKRPKLLSLRERIVAAHWEDKGYGHLLELLGPARDASVAERTETAHILSAIIAVGKTRLTPRGVMFKLGKKSADAKDNILDYLTIGWFENESTDSSSVWLYGRHTGDKEDRIAIGNIYEPMPFTIAVGDTEQRWKKTGFTFIDLDNDPMKEYNRVFKPPIERQEIPEVPTPQTAPEKVEAAIDAIERQIRTLRAKEHDYNSSNIVMARRVGKQHEYEELLKQADEAMMRGNPASGPSHGSPGDTTKEKEMVEAAKAFWEFRDYYGTYVETKAHSAGDVVMAGLTSGRRYSVAFFHDKTTDKDGKLLLLSVNPEYDREDWPKDMEDIRLLLCMVIQRGVETGGENARHFFGPTANKTILNLIWPGPLKGGDTSITLVGLKKGDDKVVIKSGWDGMPWTRGPEDIPAWRDSKRFTFLNLTTPMHKEYDRIFLQPVKTPRIAKERTPKTESEKIEEKIDIIQRDIRDYRAKTSDFDSPPLVIAEKLGKRAKLEELLKQADELMMRGNPASGPSHGSLRTNPHPFIEFVCHNTDFPDSTPLKTLGDLADDLGTIEGVEVKKEDWSHEMPQGGKQVSLRAIIWRPDIEKAKREIRAMAKKHGVRIDLEVDSKGAERRPPSS